MSWCRWSTDIDNKCSSDLYIYDHVDGDIVCHVAGRRRSNYAQNPYRELSWADVREHDTKWIQEYIEHGKKRQQWFEDNDEWENLPDEYVGKTYSFDYDYIEGLVEFLHQARKDGINFPDYLFEYCLEYVKEDSGEKLA